MTMTRQQYRELAERGGRLALTEALATISAVTRAVPKLRDEARTALMTAVGAAMPTTGKAATLRRRMSRAERKAVSERMTKYWAARRAKRAKG